MSKGKKQASVRNAAAYMFVLLWRKGWSDDNHCKRKERRKKGLIPTSSIHASFSPTDVPDTYGI